MFEFLNKIGTWFKNIFSKFEKMINENVLQSIEFVDKIKQLVNNPILDIVTSLTPNDVDDKILIKTREYLVIAIDTLKITDECLKKTTTDEKITCFIESLRQLSPEMQKAVYQRLSVILSKLSTNGDVDGNVLAKKIEEIYQKYLSEKK